MFAKYHYTDEELKTLLKIITILVDTREKANEHITVYFTKKDIPYKKLNFGDYSFYLPANPNLGIPRDTYFTNNISIERKNFLEELSSNLTNGRQQFETELIKSSQSKLILMVENANFADIFNNKYNTGYNSTAFIATLKTYEARYNLNINFITAGLSGSFIHSTFYYHLRESLLQSA